MAIGKMKWDSLFKSMCQTLLDHSRSDAVWILSIPRSSTRCFQLLKILRTEKKSNSVCVHRGLCVMGSVKVCTWVETGGNLVKLEDLRFICTFVVLCVLLSAF
jgi:hypothetical protein